MIDSRALLQDCQKLVSRLEDDLREHCAEVPALGTQVRERYDAARAGSRTGLAYEVWLTEYLSQVAVAWVLASVFARFLEDNGLVDPPRLAGPGPRLGHARDQRTLFFQRQPAASDREYLQAVFRDLAELPAMRELLDEGHSSLWELALSADGAAELVMFWHRIDPATGALVHDFTDSEWSTRFLGDLYQDLSESVRKRYALLQTPEFVEEFILDRTLTPAIREFGYQEVRLIDPACGSGHFLLGAFARLHALWCAENPAINSRELAQRALDGVAGVDLNPFAVAIARFRLLLAALRVGQVERLADAPGFRINLAVGDSLLHGPIHGDPGRGHQGQLVGADPIGHLYSTEHADELRRILHRRYHAVVANPPYITVSDPVLNRAYRERYDACHRQFSAVVPFLECLFDLAHKDDGRDSARPELVEGRAPEVGAGYIGTIVSNSFMKREFGKKLIEQFIPRWDLTHVLDTSGAYIPGHGTPTGILFARNRRPVDGVVRAVMGIRGEPSTPEDPSRGKVWSEIVSLVDRAGTKGDFVSVSDVARERFQKHPWSLGGGGAAELRETLDARAARRLSEAVAELGFVSLTRADDIYFSTPASLSRVGIPAGNQIINVEGDRVRDWTVAEPASAVFPYAEDLSVVAEDGASPLIRYLWPHRTGLWLRRELGGNHRDLGLTWYEWSRFIGGRYRTPLSITFAEVATHNHFVLDRGGKVFKQTAPVIKLPPDASVDDHLAILGPLNSSTGCFWMRQVAHLKGGGGIGRGLTVETWEHRHQFDGTKLLQFPLPRTTPLERTRRLDDLAQQLSSLEPSALVTQATPTRERLRAAEAEWHRVRALMIAHQEELDWECYRSYGLLDDSPVAPLEDTPPLALGQRAFEIAMARAMARGELTTTWFERHGSTPIVDFPSDWPADYRRRVQRCLELMESNPNIRLIEKPEYKRRWNTEPWNERLQRALRGWLLDRLEDRRYWPEYRLTSTARLADRLHADAEFLQVAELYRDRPDFDLARLVAELAVDEAVPFLPVLRYKPTGLRKRAEWERTWELQRQEDREPGRKLDITVPPKYASADFLKSTYWRLRGKLDVPRERFVLYPHAERDADPSPVLGWAGWDHLEQARALAATYVERKDSEGWDATRLTPLLAGLLELIPWLKQWHNDPDPDLGQGMGDYFDGFAQEEARALGLTLDDLRQWKPTKRCRGA